MVDGTITGEGIGGSTSGAVTSIGTSGNYLTYVKDGVTEKVTVPYATNANTAYKLQNKYYIWGQPFDGTGSVSGSLTGVTSINASSYISANILRLNTTSNLYNLHCVGSTFLNGKTYIVAGLSSYSTAWRENCLTIGKQDNATTVNYGLNLWTTGNGNGHIQQGRVDSSGTYYNLAIQEFGGNVGIGKNTPSYKLDVSGSIHASGSITENSDRRFKSDIKPLVNRGYIEPKTFVKDGTKHIGFIAQDVQKLYPELVVEDNTEEHYLSLSYSQYVAVLQAQIIELNERIKKLEQLNN